MSDLNTKQKILNAAIRLFNEHGLANVRLQQIADDIGISVGNLAYHFRNKEAILDAVCEQMSEEISEILSNYRIFPNLIDLDNQLSKYFSFFTRYPFYTMDLLEMKRNFPEVYAHQKCLITKMISQIRNRFDYKQKRGILQPENPKGIYDIITDTIWTMILFWVPKNLVRGQEIINKEDEFKESVWSQIYPYFTDKGKMEFEQLIVPLLNQSSAQ